MGYLSTLKLNGHADLELRQFVFCERSKARYRQNGLSLTGAWPVECLVSRRCLQSKLPAKLLLARCFAILSRTCVFDSILEQLGTIWLFICTSTLLLLHPLRLDLISYQPQFYREAYQPVPAISAASCNGMCIRVVEKFSVCGCVYHVHSVDRCAYYGRHQVVDKVIWVGTSCQQHGGR